MFGIKRGKNIALFVDGPNIIRKEFNVNLDELRRVLEKHGRLMIGKVFLNQYASEKLVEAIANQGFEPAIFLAGEADSDVDVALAVSVVKAAYLPAIQVAKEQGKKVVVIGINPGFSRALQNAADSVEILTSNKKK